MFEDYIEEILKAYYEKKKNEAFLTNLTELTPAKLREECLAVYQNRYSEKDNEMLNLFFGHEENIELSSSIREVDLDKFRPLINFLAGRTSTTESKNIELLAWLIDFNTRPFDVWQRNRKGRGNEILDFLFKFKWIATIIFLILISGGATYWFLEENKAKTPQLKNLVSGMNDCMYWVGDHYELISCNGGVSSTQNKIPFDSIEFNNLKKINCPDTLTEKDLGKTWYIKLKNDIEVFTAKGRYPLDTNRVLKPLTKYIIDAYIPKKKEMALLGQKLKTSNIALVLASGVVGIWLLVFIVRRKKTKVKFLR